MDKKLIISFVLSAALCAPQAQATSGLLTRARQFVAMVVKSPNITAAITQGERAVANPARNASKTAPEVGITQSARQPMAQSVSRSFATQAPRVAHTAQQLRARLAAGVGLAGAIGAVTYVQANAQQNPFPKDFLITTKRDKLETMLEENPDYARQFADLVTAENFGSIDCGILYTILTIYPMAAIPFADYALAHIERVLSDTNGGIVLSLIMEFNPEAVKQYAVYASAHIETLVEDYNGACFLNHIMKHNPETMKQCTTYALAHIEVLVECFGGVCFLEHVMQNNPEIVKGYTEYAVKHIEKLVTGSAYGTRFLCTIMAHEPAVRDLFVSYVSKCVETIFQDPNGIYFLSNILGDGRRDIIKQNSELVEAIASQALAHIEELMKVDDGVGLLRGIMDCNPQATRGFASYALAHLETLVKDERGVYFLSNIKKHDPEVLKRLTSYAVTHIEELVKDGNGVRFLHDILKDDPEEAKIFMSHGLAHVETLVKHESGVSFLNTLMGYDTEAAKALTVYALTHVETLIKDEFGQHFLGSIRWYDSQAAKVIFSHGLRHIEDLVKNEKGLRLVEDMTEDNPQAVETLGQYGVDNFGSLQESLQGRKFIKHLTQYPQVREKLIAVSQQTEEHGTFLELIDQAKKNGKTQTELHLAENYFVKKYFGDEYDLFPGFRGLVKNVIALEKEYGPKGYYTFVHAQQWPYHMTEAMYRRLKEITLDTELPYFRYMFTKEEFHDGLSQKATLGKEERMRRDIIEKGRANFEDHDTRLRQLFVNAAFFGNTTSHGLGSSSAHYFSTNSNVSEVRVSPKDMFGMYGQGVLYEKYKNEFDELEKEHAVISKGYGNMLFLAVPKDKVSDFVVQVAPGGYLTKSIVNGKETNDIRVILDALATDPSTVKNADQKEFVLAMTDTAGLDPKSGIIFHSVNAADPEKLAAWQQKFDAFMTKIAPEFKAAYEKKKREQDCGNENVVRSIAQCKQYAQTQGK